MARIFDMGLGEAAKAASDPSRFRIFKMSDMADIERPRWLFPGLLMQRQIGCIYGPPGSFKSFVALHLASALAHGLNWQGRPLVKSRVLYLCGEGFPMFYPRRLAWFAHTGIKPHDDDLGVINGAFKLMSADETNQFIAEMKSVYPDGLGLIVFDTLSTFTAGEDESESAVMTATIENAKLVGRELNCAVLFVHHPGKDPRKGPRGHSSLLGNLDTMWRASKAKDDNGCTLFIDKQKDAEQGSPMFFSAHKIALGLHDEIGGQVTSLALVPSDSPPPPPTRDHPVSSIPRDIADRNSIASLFNPGDSISRNALAEKLKVVISTSSRTAVDRIKGALSGDWQRARRNDGCIVELRCLEATTNGKSATIEMRILASADAPADDSFQDDEEIDE